MILDRVDDGFLCERAAAGDGAALAALLQDYEPRLLEYARRRLPIPVRSLAEPEDIVQETCYEACRLIRGFVPQGPHSFYRWLVRIANFRIRAIIQKCRSRRTYAASAGMDDETAVYSALEQLVLYRRTPSASAAMHEFTSRIEQSLDRLIPDYRQVIVYRYLEGLSVDETAQRMNRNSDQIYVLCSRAIGALRSQLATASHYT